MPIILEERMVSIMQIKVRIFLGENMVEPSDLAKLTISNTTIDRIVNDIADSKEFQEEQEQRMATTEIKAHSA